MRTDKQIRDSVRAELDYLRSNNLEVVEQLVIDWARERGILDNSNALAQLRVTKEEVNEVEEELSKVNTDDMLHEDLDEVILEYGDVLVTLIVGMHMMELDMSTCLNAAYNKIAKRSGKMIDGKFVKEEDLETKD